ncbi:MAG: hypothetical protein RIF32_05455 [Leptospirales bacterium]
MFALLLLGATVGRCDGLNEFLNPYQLPVRGLSLAPASTVVPSASDQADSGIRESAPDLIWTLNVGILNDSERPELTVAEVRPLLEESARRLGTLLPGIEVRFIIDQPMNSVFLIERSVRKKGFLAPKYDEDGTVLLLGAGVANADKNERRLREVAGYNKDRIARELAQLADWTESGCISEKLPASEYVWRAYLAGQVRYDLVLTNALIYSDDLVSRTRPSGHPIVAWNSEASLLRQAIVPMNGRSALEGYGALVSLFGRDAEDSETAGRCFHVADATARVSYGDSLTRAIFQLLRPADFSNLPDSRRSPEGFLKGCESACEAQWLRRRRYLATMVRLEAGGGSEACERLEELYVSYEEPGGATGAAINAERAAQYSRNHTKFRRLCGKNG